MNTIAIMSPPCVCDGFQLLKLGKIVPFVKKAMQTPSMEALHLAVETLVDLVGGAMPLIEISGKEN